LHSDKPDAAGSERCASRGSSVPAAALVGLVTNSVFGWWWADAVAGLVIAAFAIREGVEAWRGDACATSVGMLLENDHDHDRDH
jgi:Co/Zn/Cd efflux system component